MKKLLLSSIVLLIFSCSILIFEVSCQKEANARQNNNSSIQNKIAFTKHNELTEVNEIWIANIDGTNQKKINLNIPSGKSLEDGSFDIIDNGSKVVFTLWNNTTEGNEIYTCNIDGSNLIKIVDNNENFIEFYDLTYY